jgi:hypothetical protein
MAGITKISVNHSIEVYRRFHSGEAKDQRSLALLYKTSKGTINNIVLGRGRFAALVSQCPNLKRPAVEKPAKLAKRSKPAKVTVVKEAVAEPLETAVEDPVVDLATAKPGSFA